jgi:hypothetical protein
LLLVLSFLTIFAINQMACRAIDDFESVSEILPQVCRKWLKHFLDIGLGELFSLKNHEVCNLQKNLCFWELRIQVNVLITPFRLLSGFLRYSIFALRTRLDLLLLYIEFNLFHKYKLLINKTHNFFP